MPQNRQNLLEFKKLERDLIRLFRRFTPLCAFCFEVSVQAVRANRRVAAEDLCCCLADNQVQDHWCWLATAQKTMNGPKWQEKLTLKGFDFLNLGKKKVASHGPCPALTAKGCALRDFRPPTCSTQLCAYQLQVLNELGLVQGSTNVPRQIEDFWHIASTLNQLYGIKPGEPDRAAIAKFKTLINELEQKILAVPPDKWQAAVERAKAVIQQKLN